MSGQAFGCGEGGTYPCSSSAIRFLISPTSAHAVYSCKTVVSCQHGSTREVIDVYVAQMEKDHAAGVRDRKDRKGNGLVRVVDAWVENERGDRVPVSFRVMEQNWWHPTKSLRVK